MKLVWSWWLRLSVPLFSILYFTRDDIFVSLLINDQWISREVRWFKYAVHDQNRTTTSQESDRLVQMLIETIPSMQEEPESNVVCHFP